MADTDNGETKVRKKPVYGRTLAKTMSNMTVRGDAAKLFLSATEVCIDYIISHAARSAVDDGRETVMPKDLTAATASGPTSLAAFQLMPHHATGLSIAGGSRKAQRAYFMSKKERDTIKRRKAAREQTGKDQVSNKKTEAKKAKAVAKAAKVAAKAVSKKAARKKLTATGANK